MVESEEHERDESRARRELWFWKKILGRRIHAIYPCNDLKLEVAANGEKTHTNKKELISQF